LIENCRLNNGKISFCRDINHVSVEWDILGVPAERNVKFYTCCDEPYLDITFNITMRRNPITQSSATYAVFFFA